MLANTKESILKEFSLQVIIVNFVIPIMFSQMENVNNVHQMKNLTWKIQNVWIKQVV